jgi:aspartyl-tRNA(Asn)/glutamyl-tRNA(Gln) amidotransferase subunit C
VEISREDVLKLAELVRIDLSGKEVDTYRRDLGEILDYFRNLEQVDTSGIPATARVFEGYAELREDEQQASLTPEEIGRMAGDRFVESDGTFVLQGVFELIARNDDVDPAS